MTGPGAAAGGRQSGGGKGTGWRAGGSSAAFRQGVAAFAYDAARSSGWWSPAVMWGRWRTGARCGSGVWLSDTKTRRDRLDQERLAQFAGLGLPWATVAPA
ncbi:hypothetical protein GCM10010440_71340 [Kitasatospora cinereorecta]